MHDKFDWETRELVSNTMLPDDFVVMNEEMKEVLNALDHCTETRRWLSTCLLHGYLLLKLPKFSVTEAKVKTTSTRQRLKISYELEKRGVNSRKMQMMKNWRKWLELARCSRYTVKRRDIVTIKNDKDTSGASAKSSKWMPALVAVAALLVLLLLLCFGERVSNG